MENQEINQPEIFSQFIEATESPKKECSSCKSKSKTFSSSNLKLLGIGVGLLFLSFYGLIQLIKDVASLFTR
jgi:hypothetical protein